MTTWIGASRGGSTRPWSSQCVMIRPPISRVDTPQLVAQAYSSLPSWFWNFTSNALAKFWPRKWLVPACSALRSCIIASMHSVYTAPGNFWPVALGPGQHRHRHPLLGEAAVDLEHALGLFLGLVLRWRGRCGLPARGTRRCAGTAGCASPSGRRWPTG